MSDIVIQNTTQAVSFSGIKDRLTLGQKNLIKLFVEKLKAQQPITKFDITKCYIDSLYPQRHVRKWNNYSDYDSVLKQWSGGYYIDVADENKEHWQMAAMQWFKLNIGSCIIKGKIIAIPIIEIE